MSPAGDRLGRHPLDPTPLQVWSGALFELLADACENLDAATWRVLLDIGLTRLAHELTKLDTDEWRRAA
jgi:hypothetical protein